MWWLFKRDPEKRALYQKLRKAERKWRRYGRMEREMRKHNETRAYELRKIMIHWLGVYNSAVMNLYPEDYE